MIEELKEELEKVTTEKDKAEQTLQQEKGDRSKDKEKWRARMAEVEKGVEGIVSDLEVRLQEAEQTAKATESDKAQAIKEADSRLAVIQVEKDGLAERLKKAESALASGRDLGAELNTANERLAKAVGDLKNANTQMKELEEEVMRADERTDALEKEIREKKALGSKRDEELQAKDNELAIASQRISTLDEDVRRAQEKLQKSQAYVAQLEADAKAAAERVENLEQELAVAHQKIEDLSADVEQERDEADKLMDEADKASEAARRMEEAVEAAEKNVVAAEEEVAALRAKVESLERAIEREQERSRAQLGPSQSQIAADVQADIEALETELDDAHKEIARLNTVVSQSPARKAIEKAKDAKIELLEKEKEDLLERVKAFRRFSNTPGTPDTGGPLRDLSWLHTTMHDPSTAPLFEEIARLQEQLDRANESIDDKLDKLEDAGCGVVGLTKQLEDAREKAVALEDELSRLTRREERRYQRLQRARCAKCQSKVDLRGLHRAADGDESSLMEISTMSLPSEPPTSPSRPTEADVRTFNTQLDSMKKAWEDEKSKLVGENAALQDAATRLNVEVRNAKDEIKKFVQAERTGEKARAGIEGELEKAKRTIDELEAELKAERGHLRTLTAEQSRAQRDKEGVVLQLRRTEADMADVREQLQRIKQENNDLEKELRSNTNAEQKVRLLEMKVAENTDTIERLRQERSLLAADHKELQQRYSKASETCAVHSRTKRTTSPARNREKNRIAAEKGDVARTVAALEADLRRVKKDAEAFGRDLKLLRTQKDRLEEERKEEQTKTARAQKQSLAQIRLLKEELDGQREKVQAAKDHVCVADERQLAAIKTQHNKECKGLIVQIRYLKAKFTRESALRSDLGYQKCYLIAIIARLQRNEDAVFASIARIGFPDAERPATNPRQRRTFKSVICSVVFINRVRHASALWREQSSSKQAIAVALQEVRRIRAVSTKDSN
ncbi:hypothetical protein A0H81_06283 [Grifola frondosa]|uniref:Pericentrin/AKAP-450 centrosomal targeting domain-containing protein n=1 Tax=Grifola frondosa TaxID=5627 RepID=A0A1C7MBP5_GRIFR|nr:hypothetical protein A0H81_06283 [Grifola frondosa]